MKNLEKLYPHKKAEELVLKFVPYMYCYMGSGMLSNDYDKKVVLENAKACAKMVAEEAIEALKDVFYNTEMLDYWQSVKSSIKNMTELVDLNEVKSEVKSEVNTNKQIETFILQNEKDTIYRVRNKKA